MAIKSIPLDKAKYVVVDIETTGLNPRIETIIEIGAVKMNGIHAVETFEQLVNPNRLIPLKITKLTGITNDQIRNAPNIVEVLPSFTSFIEDSVLVAHNAPFDISFLNRAAKSTGRGLIRNRFLDTKQIAQKLKPEIGFYGLESLSKYFGTRHRPHHRALSDALTTAEIFSYLLAAMRQEGLHTVGAAYEFFNPRIRHDFSYKKHLTRLLPDTSGVYLMRNNRGEIIYVGKAKNLRKRARSYFYVSPKSKRQISLLSEVSSIDHIITGTEIGALLLENKLIKKIKPAHNVRGKNYHRYPFIQIDYDEDLPTPKIVRKVAIRGFHYGPFLSTVNVEFLLEIIKDLYGLRQCDKKIRPGARKHPCFYYQINRCSGPCSDKISLEAYRQRLKTVMDAFDGYPDILQHEIVRRRDKAADSLNFEKAALLNQALDSLKRAVKILEGIRDARTNLDFMLLEKVEGGSKIYLVADGQLRSCISSKSNMKNLGKLKRKMAKIYFDTNERQSIIDAGLIENLSLLTAYFHKRTVIKVNVGNSINETLKMLVRHMPTQPFPSI